MSKLNGDKMIGKTSTKEQWERAHVLKEHYINRIIRTPKENWVSISEAQKAIEELFLSFDLPKKRIIIVDGPTQAQVWANVLKNNNIYYSPGDIPAGQLWGQLGKQIRNGIANKPHNHIRDQIRDRRMGDDIQYQIVDPMWNHIYRIGERLNRQLRNQLNDQSLKFFYPELIGHSVFWSLYYCDFFLREKFPLKDENMRHDLEDKTLALNNAFDASIFDFLNFQNAVIAWRTPKYAYYDVDNLLHRSDGPAVEWYDGTTQYVWHGTNVPSWSFENPERLTSRKIMQESNTEVRSAMAEMMGIGKFLLDMNPEVLHEESWSVPTSVDREGKIEVVEHRYRLLRATFTDYPDLVMLEMRDPSTGTGYMEGVPPNTQKDCSAHQPNEDDWCPNCMEEMTCLAAEAWRQRTKIKDYKPEVIA